MEDHPVVLLVEAKYYEDVAEEHERLVALGVTFTQQPTDYGTVIAAVFDDTCGNLIQIAQRTGNGPA